ncbi:MAG: ATP-binding cassette domain-containing protein [Pseudomonadales bacterium]|jgi:ATPase subunit of ABC transporter with duplicated ATPase domains|nr:ATP-binding cassette domain-containing protein [Pseudomonadales bacterium]
MSILEVRNLAHAFGDKVLYENVNFDLFRGEHVGLVGENGAGKTTFFSTIIGEVHADDGKINWHPKTKIGYLDQHAELDKTKTIQEYLQTAFAEIYDISDRLENNLKKLETEYSDKLLKKVLNDQEVLAELGFEKINSRVGKVAAGLGLTALGLDRKLSALSGGQRAKVILAKLLLDEPNILLLDEPTNFLDKEHVIWLGGYLKNYPEAFLLISHDTHFLNEVTSHIAYLSDGTLEKFRGNYDAFIKQKELNEEAQAKLHKKQTKLIEKTKDYIARNSARASTARQAQSRVKMLNKLELVDAPTKKVKPHFNFLCSGVTMGKAVITEGLQVGYDRPLFSKQINFSFQCGKKVVITGFNGIGKSTFLKTLVGDLPALNGKYNLAFGSDVAYFAQDLEFTDTSINPLQYLSDYFPGEDQGKLRGMLARFGVSAKHVRQPLISLSGGEQAKVKFTQLALSPSNLLIMDEPTNHLDVLAKESLQEALQKYDGSVILVSHEENFYKDWVDEVFKIEELL